MTFAKLPFTMHEARLENIKRRLARLRELDPQGSVLFGAEDHLYHMNPPASLDLIEEWEWRYGVRLCDELREFIQIVGNGGAGPYYGIWKLAVPDQKELDMARQDGTAINDDEHPLFESFHVHTFTSDPQYWAVNMQGESLGSEVYRNFEEVGVFIGTEGCNQDFFVVLNGPCEGEVWSDWEEFFGFTYDSPATLDLQEIKLKPPEKFYVWRDNEEEFSRIVFTSKPNPEIGEIYVPFRSLNPFQPNGPVRLKFLDWYEHWLDTGLRWFEE